MLYFFLPLSTHLLTVKLNVPFEKNLGCELYLSHLKGTFW